MPQLISGFGLIVMMFLAWLLSSHKRRVPWRVVLGGLALQFLFAVVVLKTPWGRATFDGLGNFFNTLLGFVNQGSGFVFNIYPQGDEQGLPPTFTLLRTFAFGVLPTIVFFSSLMSVLYYLGLMQLVVRGISWLMQFTLGTSGAETLSAAANIFVGQTEAPLVIRPYVSTMTMSELNVVMVGGFATIAGGVMAAYVSMGIDAGHLLTASVISAPAALLIAKLMVPETEVSRTAGQRAEEEKMEATNLLEAAAIGASDGMKLAINVGAMLIAFVALIAALDAGIGFLGSFFQAQGATPWSLQTIFAYFFYPFAWLMGIESRDCFESGRILGTRTVVNEFVAYVQLADVVNARRLAGVAGVDGLSERSIVILTFALCGFANFSSIGIQIGGIGSLAPERRGDLARLGLRAMIGGTLASFMTACVAGMLL